MRASRLTRFTQTVKVHAEAYANNTGNLFPINLVSKAAWVSGGLLLAEAVISNAEAGEGVVPTVLVLGGLAADVATGGLRAHQVD